LSHITAFHFPFSVFVAKDYQLDPTFPSTKYLIHQSGATDLH